MRTLSLSAAALLLIALLATSCDVLTKNVATSGPKRYKVEVTKVLDNMKADISTKGEISTTTRKQFESLLAKWESEMKSRATYIRMKDIQKSIAKVDSGEGSAFKEQQQITAWIGEIYDVLQTEVEN
jgi:hypothetical protein